jgi:hypothetical protein
MSPQGVMPGIERKSAATMRLSAEEIAFATSAILSVHLLLRGQK